jgi:NTP pyrophosphatase (non-canonical NTP hydrolase)
MDVKQMIEETRTTWNFGKDNRYSDRDAELEYLALALGGEAGELQNLVKKIIRRKYHTDGHSADGMEKEIPAEMVDVMYYLFRIADLLEIDLDKSFTEKMAVNKARYKK